MFGGDAVDVAAVVLQRADILRNLAQSGFFAVEPELIVNPADLTERVRRDLFVGRLNELIRGDLKLLPVREVAPHDPLVSLKSEARDIDILKGLPGEGVEEPREFPAGRAEDRPRIAHDVNEFRVGIHLQDHLHPRRRGRILEKQLPAPFHVADFADEEFVVLLKPPQRPRTHSFEKERAVAVTVHVLRQVVDAVVADRIQVPQRHLLLLRFIEGEFHVVVAASLRQGPVDDTAGDADLRSQHVHRHRRLRELQVAELRVAAHQIMQVRRAAAPVTDQKNRRFRRHLAPDRRPVFHLLDRDERDAQDLPHPSDETLIASPWIQSRGQQSMTQENAQASPRKRMQARSLLPGGRFQSPFFPHKYRGVTRLGSILAGHGTLRDLKMGARSPVGTVCQTVRRGTLDIQHRRPGGRPPRGASQPGNSKPFIQEGLVPESTLSSGRAELDVGRGGDLANGESKYMLLRPTPDL